MLGFIGGLVALLTPCVFPMIPLTVSFFTKSSQDRAAGLKNALTYGGFILLIYLLFSIPFHLLGSVNPEIFNEISTNPWLNIFFFVIFIVFAISFFGYFEITLPSSWVNKMDTNASKFGGLIGTFFMALTLALVSFSCTGPILGSLLAGALTADGGAWQLTAVRPLRPLPRLAQQPAPQRQLAEQCEGGARLRGGGPRLQVPQHGRPGDEVGAGALRAIPCDLGHLWYRHRALSLW
jgi:cytochrome c biogenesis protein CcdA